MSIRIWVKDNQMGYVHEVGTDSHDCLYIDEETHSLGYYNLHNGEGTRYGTYSFCDKDGNVPSKDSEDYLFIGLLIYHYEELYDED